MPWEERCRPRSVEDKVNVAGNTTFVLPLYVPGTLKAGVDVLKGVSHPFSKAVLVHFMLADVPPFADGNGRISRIMMTKELVGSGLSMVIIPTVYRDDYLGGLRTLGRFNRPNALVRALDFCQPRSTGRPRMQPSCRSVYKNLTREKR